MNMEDVDCAGSSLSQNHNSATSQSRSLFHGRQSSSQSRHHGLTGSIAVAQCNLRANGPLSPADRVPSWTASTAPTASCPSTPPPLPPSFPRCLVYPQQGLWLWLQPGVFLQLHTEPAVGKRSCSSGLVISGLSAAERGNTRDTQSSSSDNIVLGPSCHSSHAMQQWTSEA
ncbi:pecanex-like protein 2 isoform X2 [Carassius auratus]|uniref:Pecanex-like protein 2 isoform X2 n=1 Tax=Carassius auratus TaxID=7957 RepID=A0A6P6QR88_CARAU|nr:pecanex-like protein 2 isoform X2 [Carassius auratus]XP_026134844.1 pecanex-like protein 2 isoform X2 [Carassius auratus]XP_026134845.1 pecanex-like protein 2 isoform X2 [Carassius auratus]